MTLRQLFEKRFGSIANRKIRQERAESTKPPKESSLRERA